jgi:hypothetical protein
VSIWTAAEIFLWVAIAAPYYLGALALITLVLIARRVYRALGAASHRVWIRLQGSPLADPLDDDVTDEDDDADDLAEMRRLGRLIEEAPLIPTRPGPRDDTYRALEAMYQQPARTEENQ